MSKAETIRLLQYERCSVAEIALAVGYREKLVKLRMDKPKIMACDKIGYAFRGWRGYPLSDKVMSF